MADGVDGQEMHSSPAWSIKRFAHFSGKLYFYFMNA